MDCTIHGATMEPTEEAYGELQTAYAHMNDALFDGQLPGCLITLQRDNRSDGYFSSERFAKDAEVKTDEIALNPATFAVQPVAFVLRKLVHCMTHQWQSHFGTPGRRGYHNTEWSAKLEEIGVMPSDTGEPGGKRVGEKMDDYAIPGGRFEVACDELVSSGFAISWKDRFPDQEQLEHVIAGEVEGIDVETLAAAGIEVEDPAQGESKSTRRKFSCPNCSNNAWGKPTLNIVCGDCQVAFVDAGD